MKAIKKDSEPNPTTVIWLHDIDLSFFLFDHSDIATIELTKPPRKNMSLKQMENPIKILSSLWVGSSPPSNKFRGWIVSYEKSDMPKMIAMPKKTCEKRKTSTKETSRWSLHDSIIKPLMRVIDKHYNNQLYYSQRFQVFFALDG